ncbi:VOC family protein [Amycolatopsis sp. NPDC023774]|uniref:VOC family protein n=1 Tax=Amycolatopsis sp. NPDC023774 TaxID=3155015 RepID=UPI0033FD20FE
MSDLPRALAWFAALLGRPADEVVGEEHLWQLGEAAWRVASSAAGARRARRPGDGHSRRHRPRRDLARLAAHGLTHEPVETYANGVRHVVVLDPDGNSLSLAQAPAESA